MHKLLLTQSCKWPDNVAGMQLPVDSCACFAILCIASKNRPIYLIDVSYLQAGGLDGAIQTKLQTIIQQNGLSAFYPPQALQQVVQRCSQLNLRSAPGLVPAPAQAGRPAWLTLSMM